MIRGAGTSRVVQANALPHLLNQRCEDFAAILSVSWDADRKWLAWASRPMPVRIALDGWPAALWTVASAAGAYHAFIPEWQQGDWTTAFR